MFPRTICLWATALLPVITHGLKVERSHDFPKGLEIENMALRPSGSVLTISYASEPHLFDVPVAANVTPKLIYTFQNATGASSIAKWGLPSDTEAYVVVTGNFSFQTFAPTPDSYAIGFVNIYPDGLVKYTKLAQLPQVSQANGMISVPGTSYVLIADCRAGFIWLFDTSTTQLTKYFDHPLLKTLNSSAPVLFGVNGIKLARGYLYFSNTNQQIVARIPVPSPNMPFSPSLTGDPEIVVTQTPIDDFIVNEFNGDIYLAENGGNALAVVRSGSNSTVPITVLGGGNSTALLSPSAVIWQAGQEGRKLVLTNSGPAEQFVTQNFTGGGRLTFVDLTDCE